MPRFWEKSDGEDIKNVQRHHNYEIYIKYIEETKKLVSNFDLVYHIAGNIRAPYSDSYGQHYCGNALSTYNLLTACSLNGIRRIVFISTMEVYGNTLFGKITEDEPTRPSNNYALTKVLAEDYCFKF